MKRKDTSTGLVRSGARLAWARAAGGQARPASSGEGAAPSHAPEGATPAIPTADLVFHCVSFPSTDPAELADMAAMQMEGEAPLEPSEMVFAHETVRSADGASAVLCASAPAAAAEAAAAAHGIDPLCVARVDAFALGVARSLADAPESAPEGLQAVLFGEGDAATLLLLSDRRPVAVRSLSLPSDPAAASAKLAGAIRLFAMQAALSLGPSVPAPVLLADDGASPALAAAAESAAAAAGLPFRRAAGFDPVVAAAAGVARRTAEGSPFNLFPAAWTAAREARRHRRSLALGAAAGAVLWVAAAAFLFGWPEVLRNRAAALEREIAADAAAERAVRDNQERTFVIRRYQDRTYSPMEVLREAVIGMPEDVEFQRFDYDRARGEASVTCQSKSASTAFEYADILKQSDLFRDATVQNGPQMDQRSGKQNYTVHLALAVPAAPGAAGTGGRP